MSNLQEDGAGGITVEVRLTGEDLARRISEWIGASAAFISGPAHGPRSVLIADHVPDDVDAPVILLAADEAALWPRHPQVAARLTPPADFIRLRIAIEAAAHGLHVSEAAARFRPADDGIDLTGREIEVLHRLAGGASNKAVARALGISAHTAKFHVASILEKLDATSRTEAVTQAIRLGLLTV